MKLKVIPGKEEETNKTEEATTGSVLLNEQRMFQNSWFRSKCRKRRLNFNELEEYMTQGDEVSRKIKIKLTNGYLFIFKDPVKLPL